MAIDAKLASKQLSSIIDAHYYADDDDDAAQRTIVTRALAAAERLAPPGSAYAAQVQVVMAYDGYSMSWIADHLVAIMKALREDYQGGAMQTVVELVHADLFDDLLDQAVELHDKGFLGPAAVVAGSVLEEHLRKLAGKHNIGLNDDKGRPKNADPLSVDLRKAGVFNEITRKGVGVWYAQRNEAAHGRFENLDESEVERMIDGVRDFVARHPA